MIRLALILCAVCLVVGAISGALLDHKYNAPKAVVIEKPVPVEKIVTVHDTKTVVRTIHVDPKSGDRTVTTVVGDSGTTDTRNAGGSLSNCNLSGGTVAGAGSGAFSTAPRNWRARLIVDTNATQALHSTFRESLSYGIGLDRRLFNSNAFIGIEGRTDGHSATLGLAVGVDF